FIAMAVAILPLLRVGGMRLFQTESSEWSQKVLARSHMVAKYIVGVYLLFTLLGTLAFHLAGIGWFDAVNHAMTSVATAGFSTSDASLAAFPPASHWVAVVLMVLGSLPFMLYVSTLRGNYKALLRDQQVRGFLKLLVAACLLFSGWLWLNSDYAWPDALRIASVDRKSVV